MEPARLSRLEHAARLACGLMLIAGIIGAVRDARAQQVQVEAISESVTGRAPVIAIGAIANESVPSRPPATGHALRASASVTDPDLDAIASTTYRWLRNGTEVAAGPAYTATAEDVTQGLSVEVRAATDAAITDPASATQLAAVAVIANSAPVSSPTFTGTVIAGNTLTGVPNVTDVDGDVPGVHGYQWYRADDELGANKLALGGATGLTYALIPADRGKVLMFEVTPRTTTGTPNLGAASTAIIPVPIVNNARITERDGINSTPGSPLDADFDYAGGTPGTHSYRWYYADDAAGAINRVPLGAFQSENIPSAAKGKYMGVEIRARSSNGVWGETVTLFRSREVTYYWQGPWNLYDGGYTPITSIPMTVANRNGVVSSRLRVRIGRGWGGTNALATFSLVAPDGTTYALGNVAAGQAPDIELNIAGEGTVGTWQLRGIGLGGGTAQVGRVSTVFLEFMP